MAELAVVLGGDGDGKRLTEFGAVPVEGDGLDHLLPRQRVGTFDVVGGGIPAGSAAWDWALMQWVSHSVCSWDSASDKGPRFP